MGCPAKKVCNVVAGSALLQDEPLVARILEAVVAAVRRAGDTEDPHRLGSRATAMRCASRGSPRTPASQRSPCTAARARCGYTGDAEYDTIAAVKAAVQIPVIANGDIDSPEKARHVLAHTGADAVMIGRAAQGRPWIFREIAHYLATGEHLPPPEVAEIHRVLVAHLHELYAFYGELHRRAHRAQAHLVVYEGARRLSRIPPCDESAADLRRAARRSRRIFR